MSRTGQFPRRSAIVDVPESEGGSRWVKVALVAAMCFVIGVAWPRVLGVRLGPSTPNDSVSLKSAHALEPGTQLAPAPSASRAPSPAPSSSQVPASPVAGAVSNPSVHADMVIHVARGHIVSCRTEDGERKKGRDCGALGAFEATMTGRLRRLQSCPSWVAQSSNLVVQVRADFVKNRLRWDLAKGSTPKDLSAVRSCIKTALADVSLAAMDHRFARYTVDYAVGLPATSDQAELPGGETATPVAPSPPNPLAPAPPSDPGPATATVAWEVGLVRDAPRLGQIVARLPRGTKVTVGAMKDGWYTVRFDEPPSEGWLYRGALSTDSTASKVGNPP